MKRLLLLAGLLFILASARPAAAAKGLAPGANGGSVPRAGTGVACDLLENSGNAWLDAALAGDAALTGSPPCTFTLTGQEGLAYTGSALSAAIVGQYRCTNGSSQMNTCVNTVPLAYTISTPTINQTYYIGNLNQTLTLNANLASSTGVPAAAGACASAPGESDAWSLKCVQSGSLATVATITLGTGCTAAGAGVTLATQGGLAQVCSAGLVELIAPGTVSGTGLGFNVSFHF